MFQISDEDVISDGELHDDDVACTRGTGCSIFVARSFLPLVVLEGAISHFSTCICLVLLQCLQAVRLCSIIDPGHYLEG